MEKASLKDRRRRGSERRVGLCLLLVLTRLAAQGKQRSASENKGGGPGARAGGCRCELASRVERRVKKRRGE